ncbi:MAG: type II CAAX endopeptidase family protein [bacterium]
MPEPSRTPLLLAVILAMTVPTFGALFYFVIFSGTLLGSVIYTVTKFFILLWPFIAFRFIERQRFNAKQLDWSKHIRAVPLGLLSGLVITVLIIGVYQFTSLGDYVRLFAGTIHSKVEEIGVLNHYFLFGAFMAVIHSLLEEYYWRWYVFGRLNRLMPPLPAYLLASLAFAGHHYVILGCYFSPWGAFLFGTCVGIGGGFWCWLYQKQNSLIGIWISHWLVDMTILFIGYMLLFPSF